MTQVSLENQVSAIYLQNTDTLIVLSCGVVRANWHSQPLSVEPKAAVIC